MEPVGSERRRAAEAQCDAPARPGLSRDRVVDTALDIVDRDGLDGLTMRRLAADLGVEAMSLYHWFPNKAAILDALVEASLRETASVLDARRAPRAGGPACAALAHSAPPGSARPTRTPSRYLNSRPGQSVESMRFIERMLEVLRSDGFAPLLGDRGMRGAAGLHHRLGLDGDRSHARRKVRWRSSCNAFQSRSSPGCTRWPPCSRGSPTADDAQFEFGLDALLDGHRRASHRAASERARSTE